MVKQLAGCRYCNCADFVESQHRIPELIVAAKHQHHAVAFFDTERFEIGVQVERQSLFHAVAEAEGVDDDTDQDDEQRRHQDFGHLFDALFDAAHNDDNREQEEDAGIQRNLADVGGKRGKNTCVTGERVERILDGVAAEHRVVAGDEKRDGDGDQAAPTDVFVDFFVGRNGVRVGAFAEMNFA